MTEHDRWFCRRCYTYRRAFHGPIRAMAGAVRCRVYTMRHRRTLRRRLTIDDPIRQINMPRYTSKSEGGGGS